MVLQVNNFTGFESPDDFPAAESVATAGPPFITPARWRNGSRGLDLNSTSDQYDLPWLHHNDTNNAMSDQGTGHIIGFGFSKTANPSGAGTILRVLDSGGNAILDVQFLTDGTLRLRSEGPTTLDTSAAALNNDQWYYIEIYFQGDNASANWEWWIDGISEGSGSGADFDAAGSLTASAIARFERTGSGSYFALFDDVYILSGATASDVYGDCEVFQYAHGGTAATGADAGLRGQTAGTLSTGWVNTEDGDLGTAGELIDNPEYGTMDAAGPSGDSNIDGDSNIKAIKVTLHMDRDGGGATTHYIGLGDSGDGDNAQAFGDDAAWGEITTTPAWYNIVTEEVPTSSQNIRFGAGTAGPQDIWIYEMYAQLLHVPTADASPTEWAGTLSLGQLQPVMEPDEVIGY